MDASERGASLQLSEVRDGLCDRLAQSAVEGQAQRGGIFGQNGGVFGHGRLASAGPRFP